MRHCRNCQHWQQRYPKNMDLGVCPKLGVILLNIVGDAAMVLARYDGNPTTDLHGVVRTGADFGCPAFTRRGEVVPVEMLEDRP